MAAADLVSKFSDGQWHGALGLQANAVRCKEIHIPGHTALPARSPSLMQREPTVLQHLAYARTLPGCLYCKTCHVYHSLHA